MRDANTANDIMVEDSKWIEFVYDHLPAYSQIVADSRKKVESKKKEKS